MKVGLVTMAILATIFSGCTKSNDISTPSSTSNVEDSLKIGLIASYPFNGNANDESGNNYNGIVKGATLAADRFGTQNKAYRFDGKNSFIEIPELTKADSLKEFTISVWINPIATADYTNTMLSLFSSDSTKSCNNSFNLLSIGSTYKLYNRIITTPVSYNNCAATIAIDSFPTPRGDWYQVVFSASLIHGNNGDYFRYDQYLNGKKSTNFSISEYQPELASFGQGGLIGAEKNFLSVENYYFNGTIDDIKIYNRKLGDDEVRQLYNIH